MVDKKAGGSLEALDLITPADNVFEPARHDTDPLAIPARGIAFKTAGDLKIKDWAGNTVVIPSGVLAAGVIHPIRAVQIFDTGTTVPAGELWCFA